MTRLWTGTLRIVESVSDLMLVGPRLPFGASSGSPAHLPLDEVEFVVLDTELTGLDPDEDEILAIGAVRMTGTRIHVGETFERLVQPQRPSWGETVPIHRIRPVDVLDAPRIEAALPDLADFCAGRVLVAHVANLDRKFVERARRQVGRLLPSPVQGGLWLDTSRVAWWLASDGGRLDKPRDLTEFGSLAALARAYAVPVPSAHHALSDAFVTAQVWQRQLFQLREHGVAHLRDLALIGRV